MTFRVLLPTTVLVAAAVAIFERIAGAWTRTALLTAPDAATADVLGEYVSLDGDLLLAGAANEGLLDPAAPRPGRLDAGAEVPAARPDRVPRVRPRRRRRRRPHHDRGEGHRPPVGRRRSRLGGTWTEVAELTASPSVNLMAFGSAVSLRGGRLAVGAPNASLAGGDSGAVFNFRERGGVWSQESVFTSIVPAAGNRLGTSVGIDGQATVAGEPFRDQPASNAGRAWVRAAPPPCPADLDGDGSVGPGDLSVLLALWDTPGGDGDLDGNGVVSSGDLTVLLGSWGECQD